MPLQFSILSCKFIFTANLWYLYLTKQLQQKQPIIFTLSQASFAGLALFVNLFLIKWYFGTKINNTVTSVDLNK